MTYVLLCFYEQRIFGTAFVTSFTLRLAALLILIGFVTLIVPITAADDAVTLFIPSLNVVSTIIEFPLDGKGWTIDPWEGAVGHLQGTAWFGEVGNIALGGHSTLPDQTPGVFYLLDHMTIGDTIIVQVGAQEQRYTVTSISSVTPDDLSVLYPTEGERLTLITCDTTSYDDQNEVYLRRTVVIAEQI
jgi:LPXTG-site transpeptidase (sortase) family protein